MNFIYPSFVRGYALGRFNLESDNLFVMLTDKYEPAPEHAKAFDVHELVGRNYMAGGMPLQDRVLMPTDDGAVLRASDLLWKDCTVKPKGAILYRKPDGALISFLDLGEHAVQNGFFKLKWPDEGILILKASV